VASERWQEAGNETTNWKHWRTITREQYNRFVCHKSIKRAKQLKYENVQLSSFWAHCINHSDCLSPQISEGSRMAHSKFTVTLFTNQHKSLIDTHSNTQGKKERDRDWELVRTLCCQGTENDLFQISTCYL